MEQPEAAHSNSDLQKELAEVLRQRAAISVVLRAIANSPHDLQPIFDTIVESAVHLCRAESGGVRLAKEAVLRLVANREPRVVRVVVTTNASGTRQLFGSPRC